VAYFLILAGRLAGCARHQVHAVIEDIVRGIGWGALRLVTLRRYAGGTEQDRLSEGALGFALVLGAMYAVYAMTA
jgi:hypothetical protein